MTTTKLFAALLALMVTSACSGTGKDEWDGGPEEYGDSAGQVTEAVLGKGCSQGGTPNPIDCWVNFTSTNRRAFTFVSGLGCAIETAGNGSGGYTHRRVWCVRSGDHFTGNSFELPLAYQNPQFPEDLISVAAGSSAGYMHVYALGKGGVVYRSSSLWPRTQWFDGFKTYSAYGNPTDNFGNTLCLKKIDVVGIGNFQSPPSSELLALSCDGKLYYSGLLQNNTRVWFAALSNKKPWSLLNVNDFTNGPYKDFGHAQSPGDPYPLYLLTTAGEVVSIGGYSFNSSGTRTWLNPSMAPTPPFTPIAIGGPFIITNAGNGTCTAIEQPCNGDDDRFYFHDFQTGLWRRLTSGTPDLPSDQGDVAAGQPYKSVVDATAFRTGNGREMGVWHHSHRVYTYSWR